MYGYGSSTEAKYLMADEYLSGNVREKLAVARKSAELYPEDYKVNVEALEKVQPKDLTASEISVRLGATWLPPEIVSDNLIIYGHHMKDGSMFSNLEKFKNKDFWEEHRTIRFDSLYEKQVYEVIAVFKTVVYTDSANEFRYYRFSDAETPEQFDEYISKCKERAFYDTGVSAEYGDKLITLSTCEYSNANGRLVLVAKKVTA